MYFGLKKFISQFLMPMPLVCECFLLGWILYRFTQYKKTGRFFTLLSLLLFLLSGYGFGRTYLFNLERRYPAFEPTPEQCEALRGIPVVVLGQGLPVNSDLPLRYQENYTFDRRLLEGVRVAKLIPGSRLIVSMAGEAPDTVKRRFLDEYMAFANFPTNRVSMFTSARDTSEEASCAKLLIRDQRSEVRSQRAEGRGQRSEIREQRAESSSQQSEVVGQLSVNGSSPTSDLPGSAKLLSEAGRPPISVPPTNELTNYRTNALLLATSASHIPRAMKIFQKAGMEPIAAPCDYTDTVKPANQWKTWYLPPLPNGRKIDQSERACYEWLGNLYESLF